MARHSNLFEFLHLSAVLRVNLLHPGLVLAYDLWPLRQDRLDPVLVPGISSFSLLQEPCLPLPGCLLQETDVVSVAGLQGLHLLLVVFVSELDGGFQLGLLRLQLMDLEGGAITDGFHMKAKMRY